MGGGHAEAAQLIHGCLDVTIFHAEHLHHNIHGYLLQVSGLSGSQSYIASLWELHDPGIWEKRVGKTCDSRQGYRIVQIMSSKFEWSLCFSTEEMWKISLFLANLLLIMPHVGMLGGLLVLERVKLVRSWNVLCVSCYIFHHASGSIFGCGLLGRVRNFMKRLDALIEQRLDALIETFILWRGPGQAPDLLPGGYGESRPQLI